MILTKKQNKEEDTLMNIVALLEGLVNSLIEAEEKFLKDPMDFRSLEVSAKTSTEA